MNLVLPGNETWLITGVAGFIGSNLLEALLKLDQKVIGIDNFLTGYRHNLDFVQKSVGNKWKNFEFIEADITQDGLFEELLPQVKYVLHQAALGSVPRSIANPQATHKNNVDGFLNLLNALRKNTQVRLVFATSSSVYGDHPALPKVEEVIGEPQSPYAISKLFNEVYAKNFAKLYGIECLGLRYFNVFGARQNPEGVYAAVIPKWILALMKNEVVTINGDGETSRDFCYVQNAVQANIKAATCQNSNALGQIYNVAFGGRTTLNQLYSFIKEELVTEFPTLKDHRPQYRDFRQGDIAHSLASIEKAKVQFDYQPQYDIRKGLKETVAWYLNNKR